MSEEDGAIDGSKAQFDAEFDTAPESGDKCEVREALHCGPCSANTANPEHA